MLFKAMIQGYFKFYNFIGINGMKIKASIQTIYKIYYESFISFSKNFGLSQPISRQNLVKIYHKSNITIN